MKKCFFVTLGVLLLTLGLVHASNLEMDFTFDRPSITENRIITDFITNQQVPVNRLFHFTAQRYFFHLARR